MGDDEADMAQAKGHSTVGQAILTGRQYAFSFVPYCLCLALIRMRAKNVLLTHFSARYNRVPPLAPTSVLTAWMRDRDAPMVAYAFDHANMTIGTMWKMNIYFPVIREILDKDIDALV
jgi:ribonuclease Z